MKRHKAGAGLREEAPCRSRAVCSSRACAALVSRAQTVASGTEVARADVDLLWTPKSALESPRRRLIIFCTEPLELALQLSV